MRIKSYFAETIQEAMEKARMELGPEAMLVTSKKVDNELRHLGNYEVVFGLAHEGTPAQRPSAKLAPVAPVAGPMSSSAPQPASTSLTGDLAQELADLRKQIETVSRSVSRQSFNVRSSGPQVFPEVQDLYTQLISADFSEEMTQELVQAVESRVQSEWRSYSMPGRGGREVLSPDLLQTALAEEIDERLSVMPGLGRASERRIVVFAGPPGAGKTTSLVKLAVSEGVAKRTPVQILSTDTLRLGGAEQLAAYARVIGVGFQAVHSIAGLEQAIEEYRNKKLILIDTPGYDAASIEEASELIAFLSRNRHIEVQLVLPASVRSGAAQKILQRFAAFQPSKLLMTRLDEMDAPGAVIESAMRSGLPISYLGTGQRIPEDLEEASKRRLLENLPVRVRALARSAA